MRIRMPDFIKVAELSDIEEGELMEVEVAGEPICLAKASGIICAFTGTCTHIGGPLSEGELDGDVLTCPWHGAQFNVHTGKVLRGPPRPDIQTNPLPLQGKDILVPLTA